MMSIQPVDCPPRHEEIARIAYDLWELGGRMHGLHKAHWDDAYELARRRRLEQDAARSSDSDRTRNQSQSNECRDEESLSSASFWGFDRQTRRA